MKVLAWLNTEIRTPPLSQRARIEAGLALRKLQRGETLFLPLSRPMPVIGQRCHELRIQDKNTNWRIVYRIDSDAIIIVAVFQKRTQVTSNHVIAACKRRLQLYDEATDG